jgi:glutamate racemase
MTNPFPSVRTVGVFDSGVGGLSVLKAIREKHPTIDFIYIADSGNAPYGSRSAEFIESRASHIADSLIDAGAEIIVVACNTATAIAVAKLRAKLTVPIVAMEPAIKPAVAHTKTGVIGVLATERTIESPTVARLCRDFGQGVNIL